MSKKIGYNKERVSQMSESEFLEAFKHHAEDYDLKAEHATIRAEIKPKKAKDNPEK